jgi:hypothetical protein
LPAIVRTGSDGAVAARAGCDAAKPTRTAVTTSHFHELILNIIAPQISTVPEMIHANTG